MSYSQGNWLDQFVTKNAWVILVAVVGIVWWGAFMTITVKTIAESQDKILESYKSVEQRYGELSTKVSLINGKLGIN